MQHGAMKTKLGDHDAMDSICSRVVIIISFGKLAVRSEFFMALA